MVLSIQRKQNLKGWLLLLKSVIVLLIYYFWLHFHAGKCQFMQSIFPKENADKALKYRLYRHLPAYEKIIRDLVSFSLKKLLINYQQFNILYSIFSVAGLIPDLSNTAWTTFRLPLSLPAEVQVERVITGLLAD